MVDHRGMKLPIQSELTSHSMVCWRTINTWFEITADQSNVGCCPVTDIISGDFGLESLCCFGEIIEN